MLLLLAVVAMVMASSPHHHQLGSSSALSTASRRQPYLWSWPLEAPMPPLDLNHLDVDRRNSSTPSVDHAANSALPLQNTVILAYTG